MYFTINEQDRTYSIDKVSNNLEDFEDIDITTNIIFKTDGVIVNNDDDICELTNGSEYLGAIYHSSNEDKYYKSIYSFGDIAFTVEVSEDEYLEYSKFDIATEYLDIDLDVL